MKLRFVRLMSLILAFLMLLSLTTACAAGEETETEAATADNTETEGATEKQPSVQKKDYGTEFTAFYCEDIFPIDYYLIEEDRRKPGNDMDDRVYERMLNIKEHLGVEITAVNGGGYLEYVAPIRTSVGAGDDAYQMVMTHVHWGVSGMFLDNLMKDFGDFDSLRLDADYWNGALMEDLAINGRMYCGYNDYMLANCNVVAFNKDMYAEYAAATGDLYDHVRNKTWTMEKFIEVATLVSQDNGDGKWDTEDTYGLATWAWAPLISFQLGCGIPIVQKDSEGEPYYSPMVDNPDKIVALDEMIYNLMNQPSVFKWGLGDVPQLHIRSGRVLCELMGTFTLVSTKEEEIKVGILPYPLWDSKQEDYVTMSWNGVMCVPTTVRNEDMVGDVLEMLAWYSEPVTTAFYETLLGSKVAEAPEDAEMLELIWRTQTADMGLIYCDTTVAPGMDHILYAIPHHVTLNTPAYATYFKQNSRSAQRYLDRLFRLGE